LVVVLLGGDAGLRMGEIRAIRRQDVLGDRLWIQRSRDTEEDIEHATKGRQARMVPMTSRLREAIKALPAGLQDTHVLLDRWGQPLTPKEVRGHALRAEKEAGLSGTGSCHRLRHTYCSMLAMAGVPARTLQELAGHESLTTSQRYMHHAPSAGQDAVAALEKMHAQRDMSVTWLGAETKTGP
jgi:integrase